MIYFQAYQTAYQLAKQAEKAFQYELGPDESSRSFIEPTYWDSLKKGLLAGELLHHDLRQMEAAHREANLRELEITKHVSLALLDPEELILLRETGVCNIHIPEALFDCDFPGHYFRRIKAVRVSILGVTGPYTNVSATLTLTQSWTRRSFSDPDADPEVDVTTAPQRAITTSSGGQDGGVFELDFNDPRYLPFEGADAISSWRLKMPTVLRPFDYDTISDVVFHLSYTARDSGDPGFKRAVEDNLQASLNDWKELVPGNGTPAQL